MFITESVFFHNNYKCVVVFTYLGHRCGYVAVPPDHPLFGIDYNQDIKSPELLQELKAAPVGKRGIIDLFCWDGEKTRLSLLFNVHGGLTYSKLSHCSNYPMNQIDKVWYFGFDCAHCGDGKDLDLAVKYFGVNRMKTLIEIEKRYPNEHGIVRSLAYVQQECRNLADQIDCVKEILMQTRVQIAQD